MRHWKWTASAVGLVAAVVVTGSATPTYGAQKAPAAAQAGKVPMVAIPFEPPLGTAMKFRCESTVQAGEAGSNQGVESVTREWHFKFLRRNEQGYVAEAVVAAAEAKAPQWKQAVVGALVEGTKDLPLSYQADKSGTPVALLNWPAVQQRQIQVLEALRNESSSPLAALPADDRAAAHQYIEEKASKIRRMSSDTALKSMLGVEGLFGIGGKSLPLEQAAFEERPIASAQLGEPTRTFVRTEIAKYLPIWGQAQIRVLRVELPDHLIWFREEAAMKIMKDEQIAYLKARERTNSLSPVRVEEDVAIHLSLYTGMVWRLEAVRTEQGSRANSTTFTSCMIAR